MSTSPIAASVRSASAGIEALLKPRSVAIVGATPRIEAIGGRPIVNLRTQGYPGRIFPVNPRYEEILGLPCYPNLRALPEVPDLVMVLVSQDRIFATLDEALEIGATTALVFSSGFSELGGEGVARQAQLKTYADRGLRICGPNLNGVFSLVNKTALGFAPSLEFPARLGGIALIGQSGNVCTCVSSRGMETGAGFSHIIATGNEADLEVADYVEYLLDDEATRVFALFVEGFKNPARFLQVAQEALRRGKPIVLMKMGRTQESQRVALSHTGAMTGSYEVITGALRQQGVIVVQQLDQLCGTAALFATGRRPRGGGIAVGSLSGGMAGVIADACHEHGVPLAQFTPQTQALLAASLPGVATLANPLDMTGQVVNEPDCWKSCIDAMAQDGGVDLLLTAVSITANHIERRFAQENIALAERSDIAQVCIWLSGAPQGSGLEVFNDAGMAVHTRVEDAISAVAAWRHYWSTRDERLAAVAALANQPAPPKPHWTTGWELLEQAGIAVARHVLVRSRGDLAAALSQLKFPLALKIESKAFAHKTELDALRLGLKDSAQALAAYDELIAIARKQLKDQDPDGILVQEMASGKRELIVGLKHEPGVGMAVMLGLGGIFSEVFKDISTRVAPLTALDAREMAGELRSHAMLGHVRGLGPVPPEMLSDLLCRLSNIAISNPDRIRELDINPLIVRDDGSACVAVDVLVS